MNNGSTSQINDGRQYVIFVNMVIYTRTHTYCIHVCINFHRVNILLVEWRIKFSLVRPPTELWPHRDFVILTYTSISDLYLSTTWLWNTEGMCVCVCVDNTFAMAYMKQKLFDCLFERSEEHA